MMLKNRNLRRRLLSGLRWPATLAPAVLGVSLTGAAHAQAVISTDLTSTYSVSSSTTSVTVDSGITIDAPSGSGISSNFSTSVTIDNYGAITGATAGIDIPSGIITNELGATINRGENGVYLRGGSITNLGTISGPLAGVFLSGTGTIINGSAANSAAQIQSNNNIGIYTRTGSLTLTNYGSIQGTVGGVQARAGASVTNYGSITASASNGSGLIIFGGGTVINYGSISGTLNAIGFSGTPVTLSWKRIPAYRAQFPVTPLEPWFWKEREVSQVTSRGFLALTMGGTAWTLSDTATANNTEITSGTLTETGTLHTGTIQIGNGGRSGHRNVDRRRGGRHQRERSVWRHRGAGHCWQPRRHALDQRQLYSAERRHAQHTDDEQHRQQAGRDGDGDVGRRAFRRFRRGRLYKFFPHDHPIRHRRRDRDPSAASRIRMRTLRPAWLTIRPTTASC